MGEIYDFYNAGAEIGRLERGLGKIEFYRTKEILSGYIKNGCVIYDIGGGIGMYSAWLARQGNEVHLLELSPNAVDYAQKNMMTDCAFFAETSDARHIDRPDESADVALLMGPLYHLQNYEDRKAALREAYRVLKKDGVLIVTGISKFSSTTWALSVYGEKNNYIDDPPFFDMLRSELTTGNHNRPRQYPSLIAESYFATPQSFAAEITDSGFDIVNSHAIEGCIWFTPHLEEKWEDEASQERLLEIIHLTEHDQEIIGMSPHFLIAAQKSVYEK